MATHDYYRVTDESVVLIPNNDVAREVRSACTLANYSNGDFAETGEVQVRSATRGFFSIKRDDKLSRDERVAAGLEAPFNVVEAPALEEAPVDSPDVIGATPAEETPERADTTEETAPAGVELLPSE